MNCFPVYVVYVEFAEQVLQCIYVCVCVLTGKTLMSARGKCAASTAVVTRLAAINASVQTATDWRPIVAPAKVRQSNSRFVQNTFTLLTFYTDTHTHTKLERR